MYEFKIERNHDMIEHKPPTVATTKRLFAVSGNQCAFPQCELSLVENKSGKVTGRICHIKARRENGPRFDHNQNENQNRHFDNLILMCPIHHDVIDSDPKSYTVERLINLKQEHENTFNNFTQKLSDDTAEIFIRNIKIENIKINSFYSEYHVNRSQIAQTIVNQESGEGKLFLIERKISSLHNLQFIYNYILPEKIFPDMDWSDALYDIALRFSSIKNRIFDFLKEYSGFIDKNLENKLNICMNYCTEGNFEFDINSSSLTSDGYNIAEKLYKNFSEVLESYKDMIRNELNNNFITCDKGGA